MLDWTYGLPFICAEFIATTTAMVFLLTSSTHVRGTYRSEQDAFPHWMFAVAPCAGIALLRCWSLGPKCGAMEFMYSISMPLEAIATLPQVRMHRKHREVESFTGGCFILTMGLYRFLYALNWVYKAHTEEFYSSRWFLYVCGVVQAFIGFAGFFWPPENPSSGSAPLVPQLKSTFESMRNMASASLFLFLFLFQ
jgi:ER lumen protein retaining receptor